LLLPVVAGVAVVVDVFVVIDVVVVLLMLLNARGGGGGMEELGVSDHITIPRAKEAAAGKCTVMSGTIPSIYMPPPLAAASICINECYNNRHTVKCHVKARGGGGGMEELAVSDPIRIRWDREAAAGTVNVQYCQGLPLQFTCRRLWLQSVSA
jgi:hypothetical protein